MKASRRARPRFGTLAWVEVTNGALRAWDYPPLLASSCAAAGSELSERLRVVVGWKRPLQAHFEMDALSIPSTEAAREVQAVCAQLVPAHLQNHSFRTFAWATILGEHEGIEHDRELLFIASMLHDAGLSEPHSMGVRSGCFTTVGSSLASEIGIRAGWRETSCRTAAEAVTLHMNPNVRLDDGPEAHLLARATRFDVVGNRFRCIDEATRAEVVRRWPREQGIKECFVELFGKEKHHGRSRANFYRLLGFRLVLRATSFWNDE